MYYFVRHGKLNLPYKNHGEMPFEVLVDLASGKLSPPIDEKITRPLIERISMFVPFKRLEKIYTSPSRRCKETASLVSDYIEKKFQRRPRIIILQELKEIHFDLKKIYALPPKPISIEAINQSVFRAMLSGNGAKPIKEAYSRIRKIFSTLKREGTEETMLITHDFLMRAIEIYSENGGVPKRTTHEDLLQTQRNSYLQGFAVQLSPRKFLPL